MRALIIGYLGLIALTGCGGPESPAAKHEWSVIETIEAQNKSTTIAEMTWITTDEYHLVGFESAGHRTWIMLNPREVPYYKQMPKGEYKLSSHQLDQIKASGLATPTVVECLTSHVSD